MAHNKLIQFAKISLLTTLLSILLLLASITTMASDAAPTVISIPSIDVATPVTDVYIRQFADGSVTWDVSHLRWNVGRFDGLQTFGQPGNTVVGGHSEQARGVPDVFYNLDQVQVGDEIIVIHNGAELQYQVTEMRSVAYTDLTPILNTGDERLTLITCDTGSYETETGFYDQRIVVVAVRVG